MFVFSTYLLVFLLKFRSRELVGCGIWFCIQRVSTLHTFDRPRYPKNKKYLEKRDDTPLPQKQEIPEKMWWWHHHHVFSGISCFWGRGVRQKYAVWVFIVCGIKFRIQWALPIKIWVKTQGDMSKIWTQKIVFFFLPPKLILFYYFNYYLIIFLRRPILYPKIPLMMKFLRLLKCSKI